MTQRSKAQAIARKGRKKDQLGENPVCFRCGHDGFDALWRVRAQIFEEHHGDGRNHTPAFTIITCRNCHAILHGKYTDAGVLLEVQRSPLDTLIQKRRARECLLRDLLDFYRQDTRLLERIRDHLDEHFPDWNEELDQ